MLQYDKVWAVHIPARLHDVRHQWQEQHTSVTQQALLLVLVWMGILQVHLHEHAGLVYVDSAGGCVTAWLTPSGTPLGLQVKAAGGVSLDPALKVRPGGQGQYHCRGQGQECRARSSLLQFMGGAKHFSDSPLTA
jgi:hypothetical protein